MGPYEGLQVRDREWYKYTRAPLTADGKLPFYRYVVRTKGRVEVSWLSCAMCHTRVLPDRTVVKGAQGNFPFGKALAYDTRKVNVPFVARTFELMLYGAPWLRPDPPADLGKKSVEDIAAAHALVPPGVLARHGSGVWSPVQVPDLIGMMLAGHSDSARAPSKRQPSRLPNRASRNNAGLICSGRSRLAPFTPGCPRSRCHSRWSDAA
jgi:hypothetical protein